MFDIKVNLTNEDYLEKYIQFVKKFALSQYDIGFQGFLKKKVWETVLMITDKELKDGTSNDEEISLYKESHKIIDTDDGFILYNDATIPADKYNIMPFDTSGYPEGQFSIALAFEYGVGIIGQGSYTNDKFQPWEYNNVNASKSKHRKDDYWYLPKNVFGESGYMYSGYQGFEIYRKTALFIENSINLWVNEYVDKFM